MDAVALNTVALILALLFTCLVVMRARLWFKIRCQFPAPATSPFVKPTRKLTPEERTATENYLIKRYETFSVKAKSIFHPPATTTSSTSPVKLSFAMQNDSVYTLTGPITRYKVAGDEHDTWRYYLDAMEVHLPLCWEQYITQNNHIEVIQTQGMPLVISINGHSFKEYSCNVDSPLAAIPGQNALHKEESEYVELVNIRKETPEEHAIEGANGLKEAVIISIALFLLFFSLVVSTMFSLWLIVGATVLMIWGCWGLFCPLSEKVLKDVHCLRGIPKRWGLFGEFDRKLASNIALGAIDLVYPAHWQPYLAHYIGEKTNIDIYLNRQVVRQGQYLSLHDEIKKFPLQRWGKNCVLMIGSLLALVLLLVYVPLSLPLKLSMAWFQSTQTHQVANVQSLEKMSLRVGDVLKVHGVGMCHVPSDKHDDHHYAFTPFDCSGIHWHTTAPLPSPESAIIEKVTALIASLSDQLHALDSTEQHVDAQNVGRPNVVLLNNFSDITLKTHSLCSNSTDCIRLKNALVNLGNARDWLSLVNRAKSGALEEHVLLRPMSAKALDDLVSAVTSSFVYRETYEAIKAFRRSPSGGFLIICDEGKQLVNHPIPSMQLYDYPALDQWRELQRLSNLLLHTPFRAEGIITDINVDAQGTRHIVLHRKPDWLTLCRYLSTSLLLLIVTMSLVVNIYLCIRRIHKNKHRIADIQAYYDRCFNRPRFTYIIMPICLTLLYTDWRHSSCLNSSINYR